jgi:hypothetical protein
MSEHHLEKLIEEITPLRMALMQHGIYSRIRRIEDLRIFMESHIYAVWDFMSLVKALQRELTCISVPWLPSLHTVSRRFINEIVLGEESDIDCAMQYTSHFELYRSAMMECKADVSSIDLFISSLRQGVPLRTALWNSGAPLHAARFVESTWRFLTSKKTHVIAAAFAFGREDLIPDMFRAFVADLSRTFPGQLELLQFYLERHIDLDEHSHTPMSLQMMQDLCGDDERRWHEATQAASDAIRDRIALWDSITLQIELSHQAVAQAL